MINIVMIAPEFTPVARCGRLGDAVGELARQLHRRGARVSVVLPLYRQVRETLPGALEEEGGRVRVPMGERTHEASIHRAYSPDGVELLLVRHDGFFDRPEVYGPDDLERYIFFSRVASRLALHLDPAPSLLHLHGWQTALVAALMRERGVPVPTVLSVHDAAFQGVGPAGAFGLTGLPQGLFGPDGFEFYGQLNLLKGGIATAGRVVLNGPLALRRVLTTEGGCGLDGVFCAHEGKLCGIADPVPPVDEDAWPRSQARAALLAEAGLPAVGEGGGPVVLVADGVPSPAGLLGGDVRLVRLGGQGEAAWVAARQRFPERVGVLAEWSPRLLAGGDVIVFAGEPEEALLMAALQAGVLPVVRAVPGLFPLVRDVSAEGEWGNAFLYHDQSPEALKDALKHACRLFAAPARWASLVAAARSTGVARDAAAIRYESLYRTLIQP